MRKNKIINIFLGEQVSNMNHYCSSSTSVLPGKNSIVHSWNSMKVLFFHEMKTEKKQKSLSLHFYLGGNQAISPLHISLGQSEHCGAQVGGQE